MPFDGAHTGRQLMEGTRRPSASSVCTGWAPRVPTRLYRAQGDEQTAVECTACCHAALRRHGVDEPVVDVAAVDHQGSRPLGSTVAATAGIVRRLIGPR